MSRLTSIPMIAVLIILLFLVGCAGADDNNGDDNGKWSVDASQVNGLDTIIAQMIGEQLEDLLIQLDSLESANAALKGEVVGLKAQVVDLSNTNSAYRGQMAELKAANTVLGDKLVDLSAVNSVLKDDIKLLGGRVEDLETVNSALEDTLASLRGRADTLEGNVVALGGRAETLEGDVATLKGRADTFEGNLITLGGRTDTLDGDVATLRDRADSLEDNVTALDTLFDGVSRQNVDGYTTLRFSGMNIQIVNGTGGTETTNGVGNLIVGYNERRSFEDDRTGSHYVVIGRGHNYSAYGGIVAGYHNTASGIYASVSGGRYNTASGASSSVSGGYYNTASGKEASVSGGYNNTASGENASVSGGYGNTASGGVSSILGSYGKYLTDPEAYYPNTDKLQSDVTHLNTLLEGVTRTSGFRPTLHFWDINLYVGGDIELEGRILQR